MPTNNITNKITKKENLKSRLHMVVVIVDHNKGKAVSSLLKSLNVPVQLIFVASGTAAPNVFDIMGLGYVNRTLISCLVPSGEVSSLLLTLSERFGLKKAGKGVAFSIPLSGAGVPGLEKKELKLWNQWQDEIEKEVEEMDNINYDLIVAIVKQGESAELMDAARPAGAKGGTLLHALRVGVDDTQSFFGMPIHAQKEVVTILTKRDKKREILKSISEKYDSDSDLMLFTMPVDQVTELDKKIKKEKKKK